MRRERVSESLDAAHVVLCRDESPRRRGPQRYLGENRTNARPRGHELCMRT